MPTNHTTRKVIVCSRSGCVNTFEVFPSNEGRKIYCSKECRNVVKRERARHTDGYFHAVDDSGTLVQEHRLILEEHLGRTLETWEEVHHIDEDGKNNDPSNLEALTKSEHQRRHTPQAHGRWSKRFDCCVDCRTTERKHTSNGLCERCRGRRRYLAER